MRRTEAACLNLGVAVLLLAATVMAESPSAIVQTRGNVSINGKAVSESSNLFNGDQIQTLGADSAATILANGQHMVVMGSSDVTYTDTNVTVNCGGLLVTLPAAAAHVNGITFRGASPDGTPARFEFHQARGSYQITDREGSVSYDDGSGEVAMIANQADRHAGGGQKCSRVAAAYPPSQSAANVGWMSDAKAWTFGSGSAFAAICSVECHKRHTHVSPAVP